MKIKISYSDECLSACFSNKTSINEIISFAVKHFSLSEEDSYVVYAHDLDQNEYELLPELTLCDYPIEDGEELTLGSA